MHVELDLPASVQVRVSLLGPLEIWKRDSTGTWRLVEKETWKKSRPARSVFKRLLVQPGRRLSRSRIEDDLWPETEDFELATKNVYNAISLIRGSCYLRLNQPERALPVLEQALTLIDPTAIRRLSRLLTYLGETHLLLEHGRQAYEYASQVLDLTYQTQSLDILYHVRKLRDGLLARGEKSYTKDLDQRIGKTQAMIASIGGFHD